MLLNLKKIFFAIYLSKLNFLMSDLKLNFRSFKTKPFKLGF